MPKEEREKTKKKEWTTPQLVVLVRGEPGEDVLLACKCPGWSCGGPTIGAGTCASGGSCTQCSSCYDS